MPTAFDDPRQQVVYELATTLAKPRVVPLGLFKRAQAFTAWRPRESPNWWWRSGWATTSASMKMRR